MKKIIAVALLSGLALVALSDDESVGRTTTIIYETNGTTSTTNYVGFAKTTAGSTVSTNDASWKIIQTILDSSGNEVTVKHAYGSGGDTLWSNAWTNRVAATYK